MQQLAIEQRRPLGPEEGGPQAIVNCAANPTCAFYESIGFRTHATLVGYSR
jgi:hypothetical protein